jgi:hypothetical protein
MPAGLFVRDGLAVHLDTEPAQCINAHRAIIAATVR